MEYLLKKEKSYLDICQSAQMQTTIYCFFFFSVTIHKDFVR